MKSRQRNTREGTFDRIAGKVLEAVGKVTGNHKTRATGKGARARGAGRSTTGRARRGGRR